MPIGRMKNVNKNNAMEIFPSSIWFIKPQFLNRYFHLINTRLKYFQTILIIE